MSRKRTVLVLGAGASCPYGFPTARQLRKLLLGEGGDGDTRLIHQRVSGIASQEEASFPISNVVSGSDQAVIGGEYREQFRQSNLSSIDRFLALRNDDQFRFHAKNHIAGILLACESLQLLRDDWYARLFELIAGEEAVRDLAIVTFNYDRSLEVFLTRAYNATFGREDGSKWLGQVPIFHVYGALGPLNVIKFGEATAWERSAQHIKLVRERAECEQVEDIFNWMKSAERIAFLGFGFDELNMHAIGLHEGRERRFKATVYATHMGLATERRMQTERLLVSNNLVQWFNGPVDDLLHSMCVF